VDLSAGFADALPYIGAADLVVTKGGWSTVAEAASAKRPLLLVARPTVPEDRHIAEGVERAGLGTGCRLEDLSYAVARAISAGLGPTPGLMNDPAAVAAACVARLS
jgi:UDP-N-acetylglucosamine:LPS N-acetylglucosamine transferase